MEFISCMFILKHTLQQDLFKMPVFRDDRYLFHKKEETVIRQTLSTSSEVFFYAFI